MMNILIKRPGAKGRHQPMLSQTAEYALNAVLYLAEHGGSAPVRVAVMAGALDVPQNYLSKTLHILVGAGLLTSVRGPGGGFRLAHDPRRLSLLEVVEPFDPIGAQRRCLLGRPQCTDRHACAAHEAWKRTAEQITRFFRSTTVADLVITPVTTPPRRTA